MLLPVPGRPILLLDAGANNEVRPEHLVQFAYMGVGVHGGRARRRAAAASGCCRTARSRARARRTSSRRTSGWPRRTPARSTSSGNVEGSDLTGGELDVVVTDGFTGNVALKAIEGTSKTVVGAIRDAVKSSPGLRASAAC